MMSNSFSGGSLSANTSMSLLARVQGREEDAWRRLAYLYSPIVYRWARKAGLQASDAQDVVQNVFVAVASDIHRFQRTRPDDSFRGWLWTISRHKILDHFRAIPQVGLAAGGSTAHQKIQQIPSFEYESTDASDEICRLRHRALKLMRQNFAKHVWEAFVRTSVHGDHPEDVAKDLGISIATVYRAKFRVAERLRAELSGL